MNKRIRSVTAVFLIICMTVSLAIPVFSVSVNDGMDALRGQWTRGAGPKKGGYSIDYSCFSPLSAGADNSKKYPLVVILPGYGEGSKKGKELTANNYAMWSSEEYQSRFSDGGAYILIARAPEPVYWDTAPTSSLKAAIDDYIRKNPNINTKKIYLMGWSLGSCGAIREATDYQNFFAGLVLFAQRHKITANEAKKLRNTAIWIVACTNDSYSIFNLYADPSWDNLRDKTADKSKLRFTKTTSAPTALGALYNHNVWDMAAFDMESNRGCSGISTADGFGNTVSNARMISWLSQWSLVTGEEVTEEETEKQPEGPALPPTPETCTCKCHSSSGFVRFFFELKCLFYRFFGISGHRTCECGVKHW